MVLFINAQSIYGEKFADENFTLKHTGAGNYTLQIIHTFCCICRGQLLNHHLTSLHDIRNFEHGKCW